MRCPPCFMLLFLLLAQASSASELRFSSGVTQTTLIELYTSEGCNSCPPAEKHLNSYKTQPGLWQQFIPLAFHVDYWDYLGWRDRFAHPGHGVRQKQYAKLNRARSVFTPAFFSNGVSWRPGLVFNKTPKHSSREVGELTLELSGQNLQARFDPQHSSAAPLELHVAVLGMGIPSRIKAGENEGRNTTHDFVVLAHQQYNSEQPNWQVTLPEVTQPQAERYALVAWISEVGNPSPLQATGGFIKTRNLGLGTRN